MAGEATRARIERIVGDDRNPACGEIADEIAALKTKLRDRTRDLITWIQIAVGPSDPITVVLAAKRRVEELKKELDE